MAKTISKSTITDLPNDILALVPEALSIPKLAVIIAEARAGEYHDFKNDKYVAPKVALCNLLIESKEARLTVIREAVVAGVYDEPAEGKFKPCANCTNTIMCNKFKTCALIDI